MGNALPLLVIELQQCHNPEAYNPIENRANWIKCLNEVNQQQNNQYTAQDFARAIPQVWPNPQSMNRATMIEGITAIQKGGKQAFTTVSIYQAVATQYPITITADIDTEKLLNKYDNSSDALCNAWNCLTMSDDNSDDNRGVNDKHTKSEELTVYCQIGDTLRWVAKAQNGTDTIELTDFDYVKGTNVFGSVDPTKQPDGSFQGTTTTKGNECYHFKFTINGGTAIYWWDPFIMCQ